MSAQELLEELAHLSELAGENPFKTRAFKNAALVVAGRTDLLECAKSKKLTDIKGIGKGIAEILTEFLIKGTQSERDQFLQKLPEGLIELSSLPGLGPKKARTLIEQLHVQSLRELEYACQEGKVAKIEGFGASSQKKILEAIRFKQMNSSQIRLSDADEISRKILNLLANKLKDGLKIEVVGEIARHCEVVSKISFLIESTDQKKKDLENLSMAQKLANELIKSKDIQIQCEFQTSLLVNWGYESVRLSSSTEHWTRLGSPKPFESQAEEQFYKKLKMPYIPAEMRESGIELEILKNEPLEELLPLDGIQGVFHNHTVRSDGRATLDQMVSAAQSLGYTYFGISEHSQTSFYANGLKLADINAQEKEVREVQKKYPKIKIFWGIESDILKDGSLDYPPEILKRFDFVIASIHQRFKLDRELMTERVLAAVRNPYTTMLGHLTGRLLLDRAPFALDIEKVVREASKRGVAIEINANPQRLDIDWRWGPLLRECNTAIFVNPDAHSVEGLEDTRFGIAMARKAMLRKSQVINSGSAQDVERWLKKK